MVCGKWGWVRVRGRDGVDVGWFVMETGKTSSSDVRFGVKGCGIDRYNARTNTI